MSDVPCVTVAKSFLLSKTIWVNIIGFAATWFGAHHMPIGADEQANLVAGVMALVNIGLRCITTRPITLTLPTHAAPASGISATLGLIAMGCLLQGCAGAPVTTTQALDGLHAAYATEQVAVGVYAALPDCGPAAPKLCKQPATLTKLQADSKLVGDALTAASLAVASGGSNEAALIAAASSALGDFVAAASALPNSA